MIHVRIMRTECMGLFLQFVLSLFEMGGHRAVAGWLEGLIKQDADDVSE